MNPANSMGYLSDRMTKHRKSQAESEFKKEIAAMANKPTFTLLDYKQRVQDELNKIKKSITAKAMGNTEKEQAKLEKKRKVLNGFFDEELNGETNVSGAIKQEVALVVEETVDEVNGVLKEFKRYQSMHAYLRLLKEKGHDLPETMTQLSEEYSQSGMQFKDRRLSRRVRYNKMSKKTRIQHMKFNK